ncbi:MAG: hypothetical protein M1820_004611 [Bogoriella megaspora]|nr:MAG: hypothetical protein M1820_004611 [Bogoriella megaspora]
MAASDLIAEALQPSRSFNWFAKQFMVDKPTNSNQFEGYSLYLCSYAGHCKSINEFTLQSRLTRIRAVFFLFYFNRLFATLVSYGIRAYSWRAFHVHIDIQSLQISLLGGRIFFKRVVYHGHNETITINGGYLTWRYWLRKVKDAEIYNDETRPKDKDSSESSSAGSPKAKDQSRSRTRSLGQEEKGGRRTPKRLPCRIDITVQGVEAFLYNRSPAYDMIIDSIAEKQEQQNYPINESEASESSSSGKLDEKRAAFQPVETRSSEGQLDGKSEKNGLSPSIQAVSRAGTSAPSSREPPAFLRLLPVHVRCRKGAIVLGNENTKCVTTAKFASATGELDAGRSGPLDIFKLLVNFDVEHPVVQLHPNHDFKGTQLAMAARQKQESSSDKEAIRSTSRRMRSSRRTRSHGFLNRLSPLFRKSNESVATAANRPRGGHRSSEPPLEIPGQSRWHGLTRYLEEDQHNEHDEWDPIEYARSPTLADIPRVKVSFYWDIPGPVPGSHEIQDSIFVTDTTDINGSEPPEYGLDIAIFGGMVHYGPWTDRQRINIQSVYFPAICTDAIPAERIKPGQPRFSTVFKIFISVEEDVVLRIPARESSKDWKWKGQAEAYQEQEKRGSEKHKGHGYSRRRRGKKQDRALPASNVRPFGWFDVKVMADTTVNYRMDMVASDQGYYNAVDVDVTKLEITTSVNHDLLWRSGRQLVSCDLSNPLQWNRLREWTFKIGSHDTEIFLLTDHMVLLLDLINDWGSGPLPDFYTFLPMRYLLHVDFHNFQLFINTNDSNIINNPSDLDDNNFINLYGRLLSGKVTIPLDRYRPVQNTVLFDIIGRDFGLELRAPSKSTVHTFMQDRNVARLRDLKADGSHNFYTETDPGLTDRLIMNIHGGHFSLDAYGFLIRQFVNFKENYFGEDLHFKTLEEYQGLTERRGSHGSMTDQNQHMEKSNALDVILCISADDTSIQLPANFYDKKDHIRLELTTASLDLRFTNYYMDMMLDTSPLGIALGSTGPGVGSPDEDTSGTQIFFDSVHMNGHRLFGLPPNEPAYMNTWDLALGAITGECSSQFLSTLVRAGKAIAFTLPDAENAMPIAHPTIIHDVTFLKVRTQVFKLWLHVGQDAFLVSADPIDVDFNDWAGRLFSQRLTMLVPKLSLACVDARAASRHRTKQGEKQTVETYAFVETNVQFNMVKQNFQFSSDREKQQNHISLHDQKTQRTKFLLEDGRRHDESTALPMGLGIDPPAMPFPPVPTPVTQNDRASRSVISSSGSSSIANSVRRMRSAVPPRDHGTRTATHDTEMLHENFHGKAPEQSSHGMQARPALVASSTMNTEHSPSPSRSRRSFHHLPTDEEREQRGLAPSTVAFSSPFTSPYFPLDICQPDKRDVPSLPNSPMDDPHGFFSTDLSDATAAGIDEDMEHTSFIVTVNPGISVLCKPHAIDCIANLVETVLSKEPGDLLDEFQFNTITEILGTRSLIEGKGTNLDFAVRVPFIHLRFLATFSDPINETPARGYDQYDATIERLALSGRLKAPPASVQEQQTSSLHASVKSLTLASTEALPERTNSEIAVQVNVNDILLWLAQKDSISINIAVRKCAAAVVSKKVDYLASLVHRNALMAGRYQSRFANLTASHQARLRQLAYELTLSGGEIEDPPFLTKASYVLRAAGHHLRSDDSWKILSRFRYIYHRLTAERKRDIRQKTLSQTVVSPLEAESSVMKSWEGWRSWDLRPNGIKDSVAMRLLYGNIEDIKELHQHDALPLSVAVRSGILKFLVDPGPRQNEIAFENLALGLVMTPPPQPKGLMLLNSNEPSWSTTAQINTISTDVKLGWEILDLAEALLKLFKTPLVQKRDEKDLQISSDAQSKSSVSQPGQQLHIVFASDRGSVNLDTINLTHLARTTGLKLSVTGRIPRSQEDTLSIWALAHADDVVSEMHSHKRFLWRTSITSPTVSVAHDKFPTHVGRPDVLKIAGATEQLAIDIKEEILGLIEIVDSIIGDEVVYIHQMVEKHKGDIASATTNPSTLSAQPPKIHIALFMGAYQLHAALLRSLSYSITGKFSSLAVGPDGTSLKKIAMNIDYDLGGQLHELINVTKDAPHAIAGLDFPPINGRVHLSQDENEKNFAVQTTVEAIDLEAAEIYTIAIALRQPEVMNVFKAIKHDSMALQAHISNVLDKKEPSSPKPHTDEGQPLVYFDVRATLAGFSIRATAPSISETKSTATVMMSLKETQATAANRISPTSPMLRFPEIRARLGEISVNLENQQRNKKVPCGNISIGLLIHCTSTKSAKGDEEQKFIARSSDMAINIYAETASTIVDVINHMQDRIKDLDMSKEVTYLRKLRHARKRSVGRPDVQEDDGKSGLADTAAALLASSYQLELRNILISWNVGTFVELYKNQEAEDLVLSFARIDLSTRKTDEARLLIEAMQLQMVPWSRQKRQRSLNSALFPELVFNVAYQSSSFDRRLAFHAAGKSLDLRLQSYFILPASVIERSITSSIKKFQKATTTWEMTPTTSGARRKNVFGDKHLASLIVDADFAGAVVHIDRGNDGSKSESTFSPISSDRIPTQGKFGQFVDSRNESVTKLRTPGIALKIEYQENHGVDPSLKAELMVDASTNILYPAFVPIVMEISKGIKEVVRDSDEDESTAASKAPPLYIDEDIIGADPSTFLGKMKLNLGLRICKQEFSLTCHPYARVAATTKFEDIYITLNTINSTDYGHFFAVSAAFSDLEATVRHVYSREDTFRLKIESIFLSLMNSKHFSGKSGISAILKIAPAKTVLNAKQLQDFLLFREIWIPPEVRNQAATTVSDATEPSLDAQEYLVQKYHEVAKVAAFPWNATIAIAALELELDLGQSIGKSSFAIKQLWVHSKKTSDWEQSLCAGIGSMGVESSGRMSGYVDLEGLRLRTSIAWPSQDHGFQQTPLIQASVGFGHLRVKAAFDYQAFAIADITAFDFLMYNVREQTEEAGDRLVAMLDGGRVQVFCTATSAAQALALVQAFDRLAQEKKAAFAQSLKEIEGSLRRNSIAAPPHFSPVRELSNTSISRKKEKSEPSSPIKLHTDVMVTLRAINVGAFPTTFNDTQIFKLEAEETSARFAATFENRKIHSALGMTLGQLRVALSTVRNATLPKPLGEVTVEEVVASATGSRGGTILKVPKVVATMQTWQVPDSNHIDYTFKSSFEGKVDVGWNYSRISYIRTMWSNHSRSLASRLGKPLPESAVKITAGPSTDAAIKEKPDEKISKAGDPESAKTKPPPTTPGKGSEEEQKREQEKITAVVNVPQSRYTYTPLEPPIIETPQLRDMGEATPPLEWIGLHRERLPNITHQIVIVTLLEVAKEVEDAYERILGSNLSA